MAVKYDAQTLLDSIRQVGGLNNVQTEGNDDARLLQDVYEVQREKTTPYLLRAHQEHLVATTRIPLVPGTTKYRIPGRAIGNFLRDLYVVDTAGTRAFLGTAPIPRGEIHQYAAVGGDFPATWFLEGNYVQLVPLQGQYTGDLEVSFYMRPSVLVASGAYGVIQSVGSGQITLAATPPATFLNGAKLDVHSPESGAEIKLYDLTLSGDPVGNILTITEPIDGSTYGTLPAAPGDYVCLAKECGLVQVPEDVVPMLIHAVALRKVVADGQPVKAQMLAANISSQEKDLLEIITAHRVEARPETVHGYGQISGWSGGA